MLTSKYARLFLFVYTLLLHGLVFLVLYKLSHAEGCKRDMAEMCMMQFVTLVAVLCFPWLPESVNCVPSFRYAHHMHEVHHEDGPLPRLTQGNNEGFG